jgi:hypothetical protein
MQMLAPVSFPASIISVDSPQGLRHFILRDLLASRDPVDQLLVLLFLNVVILLSDRLLRPALRLEFVYPSCCSSLCTSAVLSAGKLGAD